FGEIMAQWLGREDSNKTLFLTLQYYFYNKVIFIIQLFDEFSKDNIYNPKVNNFYVECGWPLYTMLEPQL
ncbi:MAG: hypothetical protein MUO60_20670, partial [Clostridiaceae bacterium]|nr:hypothetical protein [Clostridiaceae bacterium]